MISCNGYAMTGMGVTAIRVLNAPEEDQLSEKELVAAPAGRTGTILHGIKSTPAGSSPAQGAPAAAQAPPIQQTFAAHPPAVSAVSVSAPPPSHVVTYVVAGGVAILAIAIVAFAGKK